MAKGRYINMFSYEAYSSYPKVGISDEEEKAKLKKIIAVAKEKGFKPDQVQEALGSHVMTAEGRNLGTYFVKDEDKSYRVNLWVGVLPDASLDYGDRVVALSVYAEDNSTDPPVRIHKIFPYTKEFIELFDPWISKHIEETRLIQQSVNKLKELCDKYGIIHINSHYPSPCKVDVETITMKAKTVLGGNEYIDIGKDAKGRWMISHSYANLNCIEVFNVWTKEKPTVEQLDIAYKLDELHDIVLDRRTPYFECEHCNEKFAWWDLGDDIDKILAGFKREICPDCSIRQEKKTSIFDPFDRK
jgi:hypothetical protein